MTNEQVRDRFLVTWDGVLGPRPMATRPPLEDCRELWLHSHQHEAVYVAIVARVEDCLRLQACTVPMLCAQTGCSPRQIASALQRLRRAGCLRIQFTARTGQGSERGRPRAIYRMAA